MRIAAAVELYGYGTSQGVERAWDTRGRGRAVRPTIPNLNRSKLSKLYHVDVTGEKIDGSADSVNKLATAIGGTVTADHHPWDILHKGNKVGIELKRFFPGVKNLKATIHSGKDVTGKKSQGSKARKLEFADKSGMKRMYLVVHDTHDPKDEGWYVRRVGNKGDPRSDPEDPRTGWSYNTYAMQRATLGQMKGLIK
jgi:hypothetical protein